MSSNAITTTCGCGSAGHSGGGCSCGGHDPCGTCAGAGYVLPEFFAGQLLTDDLLRGLRDYMRAKNRLHNRFIVGSGVVCGLGVFCHPCGSGRVVVRPGYALDCCGNDIVVPCEQSLDINAMVHELRLELRGGYDCGHPCADPPLEAARERGENGDAVAVLRGVAGSRKGEVVGPPRRRYSLYAVYCEEHIDPVAPFVTDEPCGPTGCEPSAIREGFRFELRCEAEPREPDDLLARLSACVGDLVAMERWAKRSQAWYGLAQPIPQALRSHSRLELERFERQDAEAFTESFERLGLIIELDDEQAEKLEPQQVKEALDDIRAVLMSTARLHSLPEDEKEATLNRFDSVAAHVEGAEERLKRAAERLGPKVDEVLDDSFERGAARALLSDDSLRWASAARTPEERRQIGNYLAMKGLPISPRLLRYLQENLADVKDWLVARLDKATYLTDCNLRADVEEIDVSSAREEQLEERDVAATTNASLALASVIVRYLASCVCAALLPSCPPCEDPAVLLATIEVDECEVTHVCNLERSTPITGTALAYWLPVQRLGRLLDLVCCELPRKPLRPERPAPQPPREVEELQEVSFVPRSEAARAYFSRGAVGETTIAPVARVFEAAGVPRQTTGRVADVVSSVISAGDLRTLPLALVPEEAHVPDAEDVATLLESERGRTLLADAVRSVAPEAVREPVRKEVEDVVRALAPEAEKRAAELAAKTAAETAAAAEKAVGEAAKKAAAEAVERVAVRRLDRVEDRLKELTSVKRQVATLKRRSDDLTKRNAELERRLAAAGGEG